MTKRLEIIAKHIKGGKVFADVGCDHGIISKYVLDNGLADLVIASDISSKSLQKAKNLLNIYGDKVQFLVSDGFKNFTITPTEAVIAGMGGDEIVSILEGATSLPNRLILSPQKNQRKVREILIRKNYKICDDYTIFDNKFYDIIVAEKGEDFYLELELVFGRDNLKLRPKDFIKKLSLEEKKFSKIFNENGLDGKNLDLQNYLEQIRKVLYEN